jgi:hypothetical protein
MDTLVRYEPLFGDAFESRTMIDPSEKFGEFRLPMSPLNFSNFPHFTTAVSSFGHPARLSARTSIPGIANQECR